MKKCAKCGAEYDDAALFCPACGAAASTGADVDDHTAEYDAKDISDNKVMAMLPYLLSFFGILLAVIAAKDSPFTAFHVKQALKITVVNALLSIAAALLCWTIIVPIAACICVVITLVLSIMGFVYVCKGQAKEIPIINKLAFLK